MKLHEKLKLQSQIEVPWHVWRLFGKMQMNIELAGNQASFGEDYGDLTELRGSIEWYVDQLGGKVTWEE